MKENPHPAIGRHEEMQLAGELLVSSTDPLGPFIPHSGAVWSRPRSEPPVRIAATGFLLVYCAAAVTVGFQTLLGTAGVGLTLLLFVVLGNPSAGGAYQAPLLPGLWRTISQVIPNGAGVTALRRIVYFGGHGIASNLAIITAYIVAGIAMTLIGTAVLTRPVTADKPSPESADGASANEADTPAITPVPGAMAGVRTTALTPPLTR